MTMTVRHSLSNRVLAGASTIALAAGATLAGAGAAQAQTDSLEGSLSPDRCLGVNPATGLPGYANVYIGGDHDPGQAWITVVSGSTNIVPPMLLPDNVPQIRYTLDWNNVDNDREGTVVGETTYTGQGQTVAQDNHQIPTGAGTVEWTLREVTMFSQPGAIGSLGSLHLEVPMTECSGSAYVN